MINALAVFSRTLILNLVTHCTTVEPVVRSRHYSFTGQCLSAPVVFGLSAPPSSPTAPLRYCSLTDCLGLVVNVPVKVLGLPANQLTACYLSYSVNPNLSSVYFLLLSRSFYGSIPCSGLLRGSVLVNGLSSTILPYCWDSI